MIILAVDPGRTTGWAIFDGERLVAFSQFAVNDDSYILVRLADIIEGRDGYPAKRTRLRPTIAIIEEPSTHYHRSHEGRVGEKAMIKNMAVNTACRRRVAAALLKLGVPSLGISPEEWGAGENVALRARAEVERAGLALPDNFNIDAREHQRDAIALGGWCARRRVWEVK